MQLMFWLFREHHVLPGTYYRLPEGEKLLIRAFFTHEMEVRKSWA